MWLLCVVLAVAVGLAVEWRDRRRRAHRQAQVAALEHVTGRVERAATQRVERRQRLYAARRARHSRPPYPARP